MRSTVVRLLVVLLLSLVPGCQDDSSDDPLGSDVEIGTSQDRSRDYNAPDSTPDEPDGTVIVDTSTDPFIPNDTSVVDASPDIVDLQEETAPDIVEVTEEPAVEVTEEPAVEIIEETTPDLTTTTCPTGSVVISEISYNPDSADSAWEWVEVFNGTATTLDLTGAVLDDSAGTATAGNIAAGSVASCEVAVLFDGVGLTVEEFRAAWDSPGLNAISVTSWPELNNTGDIVGLWPSIDAYESGSGRESASATVFLEYDSALPWPSGSDREQTIYLTDVGADYTNGENWQRSEAGVAGATTSQELHGNTGLDVGSPGVVQGIE